MLIPNNKIKIISSLLPHGLLDYLRLLLILQDQTDGYIAINQKIQTNFAPHVGC